MEQIRVEHATINAAIMTIDNGASPKKETGQADFAQRLSS